jgi:hypothetical protein
MGKRGQQENNLEDMVIKQLTEANAKLTVDVERLEADKARLDWLEEHCTEVATESLWWSDEAKDEPLMPDSVRAWIDKSIETTKK